MVPACNEYVLYEVPLGVSLMTQLHEEAVGSVGRAAELVATMIRYPELAPDTAVEPKVTGSETFAAPLDGASNVGAGRFAARPAVLPKAKRIVNNEHSVRAAFWKWRFITSFLLIIVAGDPLNNNSSIPFTLNAPGEQFVYDVD